MGAQRPNVLFVTADQWRAECASFLGHPVLRTPNLDRLAAGGVAFRQHFAQAAPCGPSRASLYTGTYASNHRSVTNGTPLDARFTNVALVARALGYDPVLFGYTDTSVDPRSVGADDPRTRTYEGVLPGLRAVCDLPESNPRAWLEWLQAQGEPVDPDGDWQTYVDEPVADYPGTERWGEHRAPTRYPAHLSQTTFLTDRVLDYLDGQGDQPWFVHLSYLRPHPPFFAPEPYNTMYDPTTVSAPTRHADIADESAAHPLLERFHPHEWLSGPRDPDHLAQMRATYHGMQREVDDQFGRVLDAIDRSGAREHTIVVFTSDHGEQLGDHWLMHKLGWFDQSYAVPLIIRDPRSSDAHGTIVQRCTEHVDVLPTLCDLLGAPTPLQCDGRSLVPFLVGDDPEDWRDEVHWEWDLREPPDRRLEESYGLTMEELSLAVLRDPHGKYVQFAGHPTLPPLFYDLDADPEELHDLASDPAHAATVLGYAQRMLAWRMRHLDRTLSGQKLTPFGVLSHRAPRR